MCAKWAKGVHVLAWSLLVVWRGLNSVTEAEVTVPAPIAYAKSHVASRSMYSGKGT